ncbi:hypothetical protein [Pilibacter termitis]|uniref:hypothetical protein n=1 Tax=Pilibacter termitis TaxID=263852 RepID=UPI001185E9C7|nr:hypothetical protein [Pilibacter termitis]
MSSCQTSAPRSWTKRKAERGEQEFVVVSHSIYLLETKFPVLLRTATQHLPLAARQKENACFIKVFTLK